MHVERPLRHMAWAFRPGAHLQLEHVAAEHGRWLSDRVSAVRYHRQKPMECSGTTHSATKAA